MTRTAARWHSSISPTIAASRVRLRVHHLGDVVAGAGLGLAGAIAAAALLR